MNNLQIFNNQVVVSSRIIAKELNKEHSKVIRTLEQILEKPNVASLIIPHDYEVSGQKRKYKEYLLTKDGCTLYMFNIQGYNDFKMAYINKFNEMQEQISNPQRLVLPFKRLYHNGIPVMTVQMMAQLLGTSQSTVNKTLNLLQDKNFLIGEELKKFCKDNNFGKCNILRVIYYNTAFKLKVKDNKMISLYYLSNDDKYKFPLEEMKIALEQSKLMLQAANGLSRDKSAVKDAILLQVNQILANIGLWDKDNIDSNFDINTSDGNNKIAKIYNNVYALQTLPI